MLAQKRIWVYHRMQLLHNSKRSGLFPLSLAFSDILVMSYNLYGLVYSYMKQDNT